MFGCCNPLTFDLCVVTLLLHLAHYIYPYIHIHEYIIFYPSSAHVRIICFCLSNVIKPFRLCCPSFFTVHFFPCLARGGFKLGQLYRLWSVLFLLTFILLHSKTIVHPCRFSLTLPSPFTDYIICKHHGPPSSWLPIITTNKNTSELIPAVAPALI